MRLVVFSMLSLAICSLCGCGSGSGEVEVTGTVSLDGNPLEGAFVRFIPTEGTKGTDSQGGTDASGKFTLSNAQGVKGAVPGKYKVTVSKTNVRKPKDGEKMVLIDKDVKELLPPIYSNPEKTILNYSVEASGKPIEIKLESKPAGK